MKVVSFKRDKFRQQDSDITQLHSSFSILSTKLAIPPIHPQSIPRPHLTAELDKGLECNLTLISAPTGFGKTSLLSEWANQSDLPVLWISLSESDNDPTQFWTYLLIALMSLSEAIGPQCLEHFVIDHTQADLVAVTNMIASISQEFVVVLDNYHCIHNSSINSALTALLEFLPMHMHMYISGQTRPTLSLPRLRASRQLHEIRPSDLLFRLQDIECILGRSLGETPPVGLAAAIMERTKGWIAIFHLLVIRAPEKKEGWNILDAIPENQPYILEYLVEEVLLQQPAEIQSFLLQTSILSTFNRTLCEVLTEDNNSLLCLEQIKRANLFLNASDDQPNWYSYQSLFRNFLRERLEQLFPECVPLLHCRASVWYEEQKMYVEAIGHRLSFRDIEHSIELLYQYAETMLMSGDINGLLTCFKQIPEDQLSQHPLLCLFYVWTLIMAGQFGSAETWINVMNGFWKDKPCSSDIIDNLVLENVRHDMSHIKIMTSLLNTHFALFRGDIKHIMDFSSLEEVTNSNEYNLFQQLNTLHLGLGHWLNGKVCAAEEVLVSLVFRVRGQMNMYITVAADYGLLITYMSQGKYRCAFEIAQQALQHIEQESITYLFPFSAYLYTETSYLLYTFNKLDDASHYAREALTYGEKYSLDLQIYSYVILSIIQLAQGDLNEACMLMRLAEECMCNVQCRPWTLARMAEQSVRLALIYGDISKAEYWAHMPELQIFPALPVCLLMSILLAKNQHRAALDLVYANATNRRIAKKDCTVILLLIRAHQELGEESQALQLLDNVLRTVESEGTIRYFLDAGSFLVPLLYMQLQYYEKLNQQPEGARERAKIARYIHVLLDKLKKDHLCVSVKQEQFQLVPTGILQNFSKREVDIIHEIAAGLSNQEIAAKMTIAQSTVKWYVKNIYSKLDVHSRAQAMIKIHSLF